MLPKTIANYGGPFSDASVVENPETDQGADYANRALEDGAQLTQTGVRAMVQFTCDAGAGVPFTVTPTHWSIWGSGVGQAPTVTKTADPGRYTVTYAASFNDGLGVSENVAFTQSQISAMPSTGDVADNVTATVLTIASNVVTLKVESPHGALADEGSNSAAPIIITLWLR